MSACRRSRPNRHPASYSNSLSEAFSKLVSINVLASWDASLFIVLKPVTDIFIVTCEQMGKPDFSIPPSVRINAVKRLGSKCFHINRGHEKVARVLRKSKKNQQTFVDEARTERTTLCPNNINSSLSRLKPRIRLGKMFE